MNVQLALGRTQFLLVLCGVAWTVAACASQPPPPAAPRTALNKTVIVGCSTSNLTETDPCIGAAQRSCGGAARLQRIKSRTAIRGAEGVEQRPITMQYNYEVIYECTGSSR